MSVCSCGSPSLPAQEGVAAHGRRCAGTCTVLPVISVERAAELARIHVGEDPLNAQVQLVPIEGYVAAVDEAACFAYRIAGTWRPATRR